MLRRVHYKASAYILPVSNISRRFSDLKQHIAQEQRDSYKLTMDLIKEINTLDPRALERTFKSIESETNISAMRSHLITELRNDNVRKNILTAIEQEKGWAQDKRIFTAILGVPFILMVLASVPL
jgi:hypothetical protein